MVVEKYNKKQKKIKGQLKNILFFYLLFERRKRKEKESETDINV